MTKKKPANKRRGKKKYLSVNKKKLIDFIFKGAVLVLLFFSLLFGMVYIGLFGRVPTVPELQHIQNYLASEIYSNDNVLLGKYYLQNRTNVLLEDIPDYFIKALISTEDARFYEHKGIDRRSMARVLVKSILLQKQGSGGGSTIHQQLAKNLYPRKNYFILTIPVNKFREMIVGVRLDRAYNKDEILELYLNTVSFGENTYGIETAARRFFNKKPEKLSIEESALLVGMLKGTHYYNPKVQPEKAKMRRDLVLSQMEKYGHLETGKADSLRSLPIRLNYVKLSHNEGPAPYFREQLRLRLLEWSRENPDKNGRNYNIYTDGLKIYTTINADLQRYAEDAVKKRLSQLQDIFNRQWSRGHPWRNDNSLVMNMVKKTEGYRDLRKKGMDHDKVIQELNKSKTMDIFTWDGTKRTELSTIDSIIHYLRFLHAGLISMETETGYIRAWVGGINHKYFQYDHVTSRRQAGSTFKPVIYTAALENGFAPCDYLPNDSVVYEEYNNWNPRNANGEYGGYYSLKGGLAHSINTISVHLLEKTGIDKVHKLARKMGITGDLPGVLSLALGTGEVSLLEMMEVYSIFVNKGRKVKPVFIKRIEDKNGHTLYEGKTEISGPVIDPVHADIMLEMMKAVVNRGTASSLRTSYGFTNDMAGKTGTTQHNTDGWFIGFTPVLITGIWVGGEHPVIRFRYGNLGQGASSALPIWARYMQKLYTNPLYKFSKNQQFHIPDSVKLALSCEDYVDEIEDDRFFEKIGERGFDILRRIIKKLDPRERNE